MSRTIRQKAWLLLAGCSCAAGLVRPAASDGYFTTTDGVRLHYLEAGRGPAIVFVPGWTMPASVWERQIAYFRAHYRVIALDPRNQGKSAHTTEGNFPERRATDIKELIDHLHVSPAVLIGWSLGVRESLTYARSFGTTSLRALALVDGEVWSKHTEDRARSQAGFIHNVETRRQEFTAEFVRGMFRRPVSEEYLSALTKASLRVPTSAAVSMLTDLYLANDMRPVLAAIDVPVLIAVRSAHADQAAIVRSVLPSAETEVFEDAGHALFVDDAERFNRRLERFLAQGLSPSRSPRRRTPTR